MGRAQHCVCCVAVALEAGGRGRTLKNNIILYCCSSTIYNISITIRDTNFMYTQHSCVLVLYVFPIEEWNFFCFFFILILIFTLPRSNILDYNVRTLFNSLCLDVLTCVLVLCILCELCVIHYIYYIL